MTTLATLSRQVARLLDETVEGEATAGSTTTLTDTNNLKQPEGTWKGGTLWILSGENIGEVIVPTIFAENKITWGTAIGAVIAAGDDYEVAGREFPYDIIVKGINQALREIGKIEQTPNTALTTTSGVTRYTIPTGVSDIGAVEVVSDLGTADEWFYPSTSWEEVDGKIVFDKGYSPAADLNLRLRWIGYATPLAATTDVVPNTIDEDYLTWVATRFVLRTSVKRFGKDKKELAEWLNEAIEAADRKQKRNRNLPVIKLHTAG